MANVRACLVAVAAMVALAGCQGEMRDVLTLDNAAGGALPTEQVMTVKEKGTYYLYSSKTPNADTYHRDLKPGDQIGFRVRGNRVEAIAQGSIVELEDYSEGASYTWKLEDKKK